MRPHYKLRRALRDMDVDEPYLAELLGRSVSYVSTRMMGLGPWTIDEVYKMLEIINEPPRRMHMYFTPKGRNIEVATPEEEARQAALNAVRMLAEGL